MRAPGDGRPSIFANAVDNLGPTPRSNLATLSLKREPANRAIGDHRFNRSSLTKSSASFGPVEKSGPDFHRLALPNLLKSNIRSIPKYGSGVVCLFGRLEQGKQNVWCNLYWIATLATTPAASGEGV
jgi:hypothetical protein